MQTSLRPASVIAITKASHPCRPPRMEEPGALWMISTRTIEERFWLHPFLTCGSARLNREASRAAKRHERLYHQRVVAMVASANRRMGPHQPKLTVDVAKRALKGLVGSALARAQQRCREQGAEVHVYAFVAMSNHVHLVVRTAGKNLAAFMGYFKARVADGINYLTGRRGPLFARRYDAQSIRNLDAAAGRVAYTVDNPRKANLVDHHNDWPGQLLCYGLGDTDQPEFEYFARTDWHRHRRRKSVDDLFKSVTLTLSPLPHLTDIEREHYARMVEGWIRDLNTDASSASTDASVKIGDNKRTNKKALGVDKVLSASFDKRPLHPSFKRRPYTFGTPEEKRQYREACSIKYGNYVDASFLFRTTDRTVIFPDGMYPPPIVQAA